jgi:signal transduction histidine kinase
MILGANVYALLALTAMVASLVSIGVFALGRFMAASRPPPRPSANEAGQTAPVSEASADTIVALRAREQTALARAEASERLNGEIITGLTAGLFVVGIRGELRILNPVGRRLLWLDDHEPLDDYRRALPDPLLPMIDDCLAAGTPILRRTVKLEHPRGATHLGVTISPLRDADGAMVGAIGLFSDLTAVKDLEEQLRLKDSLAAVGELTAGIAHEFRNGLATIQGYSKLIDLAALPERYRAHVEGIRAETASLAQVVTNFLNFARPAELTTSRIDLGAVCERLVEDIRADVRALGGDVEVRGPFGVVEGDEILLRQAFSNLLRNAFEACVYASVTPAIVVESAVDPSHQYCRISVNDNGPGIEPDARERIFRPFHTSKRGGTGLGLALVQKIIVFHNGRVAVGTSPQGGASFQITLPLV